MLARWAKGRGRADRSKWSRWLRQKISYLPSCYYCAAHWVGLLLFACHPFTLLAPGLRGAVIAYLTQTGLAVSYLSVFHLLRVQIRKTKADADLAEQGRHRGFRANLRRRTLADAWPVQHKGIRGVGRLTPARPSGVHANEYAARS